MRMTDSGTTEAFRDFSALLHQREEQRTARRHELSTLVQCLPLPATVVTEIQWLGPTEREQVLLHHPGHVLDRKLNSLWSMRQVFQEAHASLVKQVDALHEFSKPEEMHLPIGRSRLNQLENLVRKELVAYSAAAAALEAFSRRITSDFPIDNFRQQIEADFDQHEHQFIKDLRNVICHQEFPEVHWQITYATEHDADFVLPVRNLESMGSFNAKTLAYVKRWPDGIRLRLLTDNYAKRVNGFYAWLQGQIEANLPVALQDYRGIVQVCRANAARCTFRLVLEQIKGKNINPYEHLHKYLLPDDLRAAMALPMRSREQIEFIIARADEYGACDDEIREKVYLLFGVTASR